MEAQAGTGSNSGARPCVFMALVGRTLPSLRVGSVCRFGPGLPAINERSALIAFRRLNCDEILTPDFHCTYRLRTELLPDDFRFIDRPVCPRNAGPDFGPAVGCGSESKEFSNKEKLCDSS